MGALGGLASHLVGRRRFPDSGARVLARAAGDGGAGGEVRAEYLDDLSHLEGFADPGGDSVNHFFWNAAGDAADQDHRDVGTVRLQLVEGAGDFTSER